jgi:hypothetical protein
MNFSVSLILPPQWVSGSQVKAAKWDHTADLVDDDPDRPVFLTRAADILSANGVRLDLKGFFKVPLPVSTDVGLGEFLENLPGLLSFLLIPSPNPYTLSLSEQGIQTEFTFSTGTERDVIEVACFSTAKRELDCDREAVSRRKLVAQMTQFVRNYREATTRYVPELLGEAWNQKLFVAAAELAKTLPSVGTQ